MSSLRVYLHVLLVITALVALIPQHSNADTCSEIIAYNTRVHCECGGADQLLECIQKLTVSSTNALAYFSTDFSADETNQFHVGASAASYAEFISGPRVRVHNEFFEEWGSGTIQVTVYGPGGYCVGFSDLCPEFVGTCGIIHEQSVHFNVGDCINGVCISEFDTPVLPVTPDAVTMTLYRDYDPPGADHNADSFTHTVCKPAPGGGCGTIVEPSGAGWREILLTMVLAAIVVSTRRLGRFERLRGRIRLPYFLALLLAFGFNSGRADAADSADESKIQRFPRVFIDESDAMSPARAEGFEAKPGEIVAQGEYVPGEGCRLPSLRVRAESDTTVRGTTLRLNADCTLQVDEEPELFPDAPADAVPAFEVYRKGAGVGFGAPGKSVLDSGGDGSYGTAASLPPCRRLNRARTSINDIVGLQMTRVIAQLKMFDDGSTLSTFGPHNEEYHIFSTAWAGFNYATDHILDPVFMATGTRSDFVNASPMLCSIGTPAQSPPCYAHTLLAASYNEPNGAASSECSVTNGNPGLPTNLGFTFHCNYRWWQWGACNFCYVCS